MKILGKSCIEEVFCFEICEIEIVTVISCLRLIILQPFTISIFLYRSRDSVKSELSYFEIPGAQQRSRNVFHDLFSIDILYNSVKEFPSHNGKR
jgi:hypothetical protein